MENRICELLQIKYPIFQGGMAWVSTAELASAVSNAGGLGIIAAGNAPGEWVEEQIKKAKEMTQKPFGVNVMLMSPFVEDVITVLEKNPVAVVTTGAGNPGKYMERLKAVGTKVIPVVPSVALAKKMEKEGASAVVAEGTESGGHVGELTTMALVPQVVDAVSIPVLAAGGIADGRGMAAAFALGADGVQIGTRFICSTECTVHENYKQAVEKAKDRDAVVSGRRTGHPVRSLKNKLTKEFEKLDQEMADISCYDKAGAGKLQAAVVEGDIQNGSVMAGQIAGLVNGIKSVEEIMQDLVSGCNQINQRIGGIKL